MTDLKKGSTVLIVEGIHKGKQGKVQEVYRGYDKDTQTTGKRVKVQTGFDENGDPVTLTTRASWVREVR